MLVALFFVILVSDRAHDLMTLRRISFEFMATNDAQRALRQMELFFEERQPDDDVLVEANYLVAVFKKGRQLGPPDRDQLMDSQVKLCWFEPANGPFVLLVSPEVPGGVPRSVTNLFCGYAIVDIGQGYVVFRHEGDVIVKRMQQAPPDPRSWNRWGSCQGSQRIYRFADSYRHRFLNTRISFVADQLPLERFMRFASRRFLIKMQFDTIPHTVLNGVYDQSSLGLLYDCHLFPDYLMVFERDVLTLVASP